MQIPYQYQSVMEARYAQDKSALKLLSQKGVKVKRARKRAAENRRYADVMEKLRQGNEDICPVDD